MPEPAGDAADRIQSASPEGRPADSKVGPAGLWVMVLLGWLVIVAVGVLVGAWQGWAYGIAIIAFGTLVMTFNPVVLAQAGRAKERREVILTDQDEQKQR